MYLDIDITLKENIVPGLMVDIVEDKNKGSQEYTRGCVKRIISNKDCKKGIKVQLTNGAIGNVKGIPSKAELEKNAFKFYNLFFYNNIFAVWDIKNNKFITLDRINKKSGTKEKIMLLFSTREIAEKKLENTKFIPPVYCVRMVRKKNKSINSFFKNYEVTAYLIDLEKRLSVDKMQYFEEKFKEH